MKEDHAMRRSSIIGSSIYLLVLSGLLCFLWLSPVVFGEEEKEVRTVIVASPEEVPTYVAPTGAVGAKMLLSQDSFYLGRLTLEPGVKVAAHRHEAETEILYCLKGTGVLTSKGKDYPVGPGKAVMIPTAVEHAFRVTSPFENFEAIQMWVPGGPERKYLGWNEGM